MSVRLLVAAAENDVIGLDGDLPWHLSADLKRFAALTRGHVVVMGRLTHESIVARLGKPLPGRHAVVVTSRALEPHPDVEPVATVEAALERAAKATAARGLDDWFVIGGAQLYTALLPVVDVVDLTRVHAEVAGDAALPPGWLDPFERVSAERHSDASGLEFSFERWVRR
ncbi:dihydrofolate reductase [Spongisporangium articulatum]|uniref:Dihydrofolate reductase n=1 Tax=Spongisporangium articulatum TaxID=3362603 RepID=A0ABW8AHM7_9ACTN